jgi:hypothetical protein
MSKDRQAQLRLGKYMATTWEIMERRKPAIVQVFLRRARGTEHQRGTGRYSIPNAIRAIYVSKVRR